MDVVYELLDQTLVHRLATLLFVGAVAFDFFLSYDKVRDNTIRDWMLRMMQGSFGPLSGSAVPYALGVLVGHFFHPPGTAALLESISIFSSEGYGRLIMVVIIGILVSLASRYLRFPKPEHVFFIALFGMVVGAGVWPV